MNSCFAFRFEKFAVGIFPPREPGIQIAEVTLSPGAEMGVNRQTECHLPERAVKGQSRLDCLSIKPSPAVFYYAALADFHKASLPVPGSWHDARHYLFNTYSLVFRIFNSHLF